jgi:hypothetical protein
VLHFISYIAIIERHNNCEKMLDEKYIIKAQTELNETEETKTNALAQLRLWISRHDFFKNCRQGK